MGSRLSLSCWGCHCALGPAGWHAGGTHPKFAGSGYLLCSHSFPCSRMWGGEKRAGASRDEEGAEGMGCCRIPKCPNSWVFPPPQPCLCRIAGDWLWCVRASVSPRARRCCATGTASSLFAGWRGGVGGGGGDGGPRETPSHPTAPAALIPSPQGSVGPKRPWCGSEPQLTSPCDLEFTGAACGVGPGKTLHLLPKGLFFTSCLEKRAGGQ